MTDALLGRVSNLGRSDIIQSVSPGGADAAIDYRGISNFIKAVRVRHTWTSQNKNDGYASIPVAFSTPFSDTNYTVVFSPEDSDDIVTLDYYNGDIHNLTASGFDAIIYAYSPGFGTPGDTITVHVIAIHD